MFSRVVGLLVVGLAAGACALTEDTVSIQYHAMSGVSEVAGAKEVQVAVGVDDVRAEHRDRVSVKKNGYGMEMAAIRSDRDVTQVVREAIETELRVRGFRVEEGPHRVKVDLIKFYNDFKTGFFSGDAVAEITFNVQVLAANGSIVFSKAVSSTGKNPDILLASGSNAKVALENGLSLAIANLMSDQAFIDALLKARVAAPPTS